MAGIKKTDENADLNGSGDEDGISRLEVRDIFGGSDSNETLDAAAYRVKVLATLAGLLITGRRESD